MEYPGVLCKVQFAEGVGYSAIHPWPELGDNGLEDQLSSLKDGKIDEQLKVVLNWAKTDAVLRSLNKNAFMGLKIPESHYFMTSTNTAELVGKEKCKIKVGRDAIAEAAKLTSIAREYPQLIWRLDANAKFSFAQARAFLRLLPDFLLEKIEFFEDPCPFNVDHWRDLSAQVSVALDREFHVWESTLSSKQDLSIHTLVLKPEVQDVEKLVEKYAMYFNQLVVTSYLGHPLGQRWAAYRAALLAQKYRVGVCGLNSQNAFLPNAFSEQPLDVVGCGLGFDSLLSGLQWENFCEI